MCIGVTQVSDIETIVIHNNNVPMSFYLFLNLQNINKETLN